MVGVKPAIAQLVEHLTVETSMSFLWDSSPRPSTY